MYEIMSGIPIPKTRGRKAHSRDRNYEAKQAAIRKGVAIAALGKPFAEAARAIRGEYPRKDTSVKHLAKLISDAANPKAFTGTRRVKPE